MASVFKGRKVELSRFKGLGEMMAAQLKETTMDPAHRSLLRVRLPDRHAHDTEDRAAARKTADLVETLMGRKPELRFEYIQENAKFVKEVDV
jgi:topoisomerase-4 subunit B